MSQRGCLGIILILLGLLICWIRSKLNELFELLGNIDEIILEINFYYSWIYHYLKWIMRIGVRMLEKKWKLVSRILEGSWDKLLFDIKILLSRNDIKI